MYMYTYMYISVTGKNESMELWLIGSEVFIFTTGHKTHTYEHRLCLQNDTQAQHAIV